MLLISVCTRWSRRKSVTNWGGNELISYSKESSRIEDDYRIYSGLRHVGTCVFCGDSFKCSSPKAKYFSQRCRNDAYIKRRKQRRALEKEKICKECGKRFAAKKKDGIYCSNACKQKAYRNRKMLQN